MPCPTRAITLMVVAGLVPMGCAQAPPVAGEKVVVKERRLRRENNPFYAARPIYPPVENGSRANITLEPFTRSYYPNENSYSPPIDPPPATPLR